MKFWVLALFLSIPASAMERLTGNCERGGQTINVPPAVGQPPVLMNVMRNYPTCSVAVFITGSGGQYATIYSNNAGQALTNPFQADIFGGWGFYVSNGTYDIQLSGGGLPAPYTLGAQSAFDSASFVPLVPFTNITSGTSNGALVVAGSLTTTPSAIVNFTQAAHTFPFLTGPTSIRPATCGVGEAFFASDAPAGQNLIGCTAANVWTPLGGSGGGGSGFLPLSGGTMTGAITGAPIQGSIYIPYPGNIQMQVGPATGQNPNCAPGFGNCPDSTLVDYFGFEGTFFRVKGGGDYFDWTRWTSGQAALPLHQLALNDSSFNNLLLVDETAGYPQAKFQFTGFINATQQIQSNQGFLSSLYRNGNGQDYFDWTTTGLGTHSYDLRDSSNTPIISYRNTSASPGGGVFTISGEVTTPPTSTVGFQAPVYRLNNGMDYFDWLSIGLGTHSFDLRDSGSNAILQYRNTTGSGLMGTYTFNGNLVINGTCTGCGTGGGGGGISVVMPTAPIVSNITGSTLNISCPNCLPTTGGTMTGQLTLQSGCPTWCMGALYLPYGSNLEMQPSPTSGQSTMCTATGAPATCPDTTLVDYFGFEGVFFRMKGGGDYFDWTRWTSGTSALPTHQLNLNNSSFVNLLNVNDSFGAGMTQFNFTGFINSSLQIKSSQGMDAPIYKLDNGTDYFEWINTGLGAHHFQIQDSSSNTLLDYTDTTGNPLNGTFTFDGNVTVTGTCTGCGAAGGGVTNVNPTAPIVASITGATMSISCPTCTSTGTTAVTSLTGTANQVLVNGMAGTPVAGVVTLTLPQNLGLTSANVQFGGLCLNMQVLTPPGCNGDGYLLQLNGGMEVIGQNTIFWKTCTVNNCVNAATGGVTSGTGYWTGASPLQVISANGQYVGTAVNVTGTVQSQVTSSTANAFISGSGAFTVSGSGAIRGSTVNVAAAGTYQFNASPAFRYTGTVPTGNVQFSNDGGTTWSNIGSGGAGGVTSVTQGTGISVSPTTGAVVVANTGVLSVTGSANMVAVSGATGNVTFTLPQAIATVSTPQFGGLTVNKPNDGGGYLFQILGGIEISGQNSLFFGGPQGACTAANCINVASGGITAGTGYWIGVNQEISPANGGQFVGPGGVNTTGTITSQNFLQSGGAGIYVATTQVISNAGGGQFVGPGGVFTSGSVVANAVGSGTSFNVGSNTGITRNIVIGGCTINVAGGIVFGSSGC